MDCNIPEILLRRNNLEKRCNEKTICNPYLLTFSYYPICP